jgi:hypothetical protein
MANLGRATRGKRCFPGDFYKPNETLGFRQVFFRSVHAQLPQLEKSFRREFLPRFIKPTLNLRELRDDVGRWAKGWHMGGVDWFLDRCIKAGRAWQSQPLLRTHDLLAVGSESGFSVVSPRESLICFEHQGWTPNWEHWDDFHEDVQRQFDEFLAAYRDRMESVALAKGYIRTPEKLRQEHFDWLVRFHCGSQSLVEIKMTRTAGHVTSTSAISKGIHSAARSVGLTVRGRT